MSLLGALGAAELEAQCSRAGCAAAATWTLEWSNPRIHRDGRTKTWLACAEHRPYLEDFLSSRAFPVDVRPFGEVA